VSRHDRKFQHAIAPKPRVTRRPTGWIAAAAVLCCLIGAPAAHAAETKPSSDSATPRFAAHLASYRGRTAAERGWRILSRRYATLLAPLQPAYVPVDLGARGRFLRLLAVPFADRGAARALCRRLRQAGQFCQPVALKR
jgi:hypothetical protein